MLVTTRPNGLPALRDLPIKFKRRAATTDLSKLVGKETDRAKHSPYEYVSEDERWIIRAVHHSGHGSTNSGRVRWYVSHNGKFFPLRWGTGGHYTISREDAIDEIHRRIAQGVCEGFEVLAKIRKAAEDAQRAVELHAANLVRAKELLGRVYGADPTRMIEALAKHVNLDAFARAVNTASQLAEEP
jgi:hypothetical protein